MVWSVTIAILVMFLALAGVISFIVARQQEQRDRYLSVIARTTQLSDKEGGEKTARAAADIAKKLKQANAEQQERKKDKTTIAQMLQMAGIEAPASKYWIYSAAFALVTWLLIMPFGWPMIARIFIVFAAFLGVPKLFLKIKIGRRQKKFLEDFPDALDGMVRLLQAGMPMSEAIAMGSREFTGPIREEMLRIYDGQKMGVPLGEAAQEMARRVPLTEVHMFAAALQIQAETGSSLSEVLSNLSSIIRERFRLQRKVKALSSEAVSSAGIIAALPFLVGGGLYLLRPEYIGVLFELPKGKLMLIGGGVWMSFGVLIMRQMINFKI